MSNSEENQQPTPVKRYEPCSHSSDGEDMMEWPNGEWVRYKDYATTVQRLREALSHTLDMVTHEGDLFTTGEIKQHIRDTLSKE